MAIVADHLGLSWTGESAHTSSFLLLIELNQFHLNQFLNYNNIRVECVFLLYIFIVYFVMCSVSYVVVVELDIF